MDCQRVGECAAFDRDPAIIRFYGNGLDSFTIHARVNGARGDFDPTTTPFTIAVYNDNGLVNSATLQPGDLEPRGRKNGLPTRFVFVDRSARTLGERSHRNGLFRVATRFRHLCRGEAYTFRVRQFGDFSAATEALMTVQVYGINQLGYMTETWTRRSRSWILYLSQFGDETQPPGSCR